MSPATQSLLAAAETLLERRADGMLTAREWAALEEACAALRGRTPCGCPNCGEADTDRLVWLDDERVECQGCRTRYTPGGQQPPEAPGCEFCRQEYNRPLDPYRCPYCQAAWPARPRRKR